MNCFRLFFGEFSSLWLFFESFRWELLKAPLSFHQRPCFFLFFLLSITIYSATVICWVNIIKMYIYTPELNSFIVIKEPLSVHPKFSYIYILCVNLYKFKRILKFLDYLASVLMFRGAFLPALLNNNSKSIPFFVQDYEVIKFFKCGIKVEDPCGWKRRGSREIGV